MAILPLRKLGELPNSSLAQEWIAQLSERLADPLLIEH